MPKEDLFDLKPQGLMGFLEAVRERADTYGWNGSNDEILQIPLIVGDPTAGYENLLDKYGMISLERVRDHKESIIRRIDHPNTITGEARLADVVRLSPQVTHRQGQEHSPSMERRLLHSRHSVRAFPHSGYHSRESLG
jgi:hypothetical protein